MTAWSVIPLQSKLQYAAVSRPSKTERRRFVNRRSLVGTPRCGVRSLIAISPTFPVSGIRYPVSEIQFLFLLPQVCAIQVEIVLGDHLDVREILFQCLQKFRCLADDNKARWRLEIFLRKCTHIRGRDGVDLRESSV